MWVPSTVPGGNTIAEEGIQCSEATGAPCLGQLQACGADTARAPTSLLGTQTPIQWGRGGVDGFGRNDPPVETPPHPPNRKSF